MQFLNSIGEGVEGGVACGGGFFFSPLRGGRKEPRAGGEFGPEKALLVQTSG